MKLTLISAPREEITELEFVCQSEVGYQKIIRPSGLDLKLRGLT